MSIYQLCSYSWRRLDDILFSFCLLISLEVQFSIARIRPENTLSGNNENLLRQKIHKYKSEGPRGVRSTNSNSKDISILTIKSIRNLHQKVNINTDPKNSPENILSESSDFSDTADDTESEEEEDISGRSGENKQPTGSSCKDEWTEYCSEHKNYCPDYPELRQRCCQSCKSVKSVPPFTTQLPLPHSPPPLPSPSPAQLASPSHSPLPTPLTRPKAPLAPKPPPSPTSPVTPKTPKTTNIPRPFVTSIKSRTDEDNEEKSDEYINDNKPNEEMLDGRLTASLPSEYSKPPKATAENERQNSDRNKSPTDENTDDVSDDSEYEEDDGERRVEKKEAAKDEDDVDAEGIDGGSGAGVPADSGECKDEFPDYCAKNKIYCSFYGQLRTRCCISCKGISAAPPPAPAPARAPPPPAQASSSRPPSAPGNSDSPSGSPPPASRARPPANSPSSSPSRPPPPPSSGPPPSSRPSPPP